MVSTVHAAIQKSPFKNIYWFSRYLLNTDQFGALGKVKESQLLELVAVLENLSAQENFTAAEKFLLLKNTLLTEIQNITRRGTKTYLLALKIEHDTLDDNLILTAFVQEFVRRKRDA